MTPLLTLTMALLIALGVTSITVVDVIRERARLSQELEEKGLMIVRTFGDVFADALYSSDRQRLNRLARIIRTQSGISQFEVFTADGRLVSSSEERFASGQIDGSTLAIALTHPEGTIRWQDGQPEVLSAIRVGAESIGGVRTRLDTSTVAADVRKMIVQHVWQGLAVIALGAGVALSLARSLTAPVRELTQAARSVADGDLSFHARTRRKDELGDLGEAFQDMVDRLREVERLRAEERTAELTEVNQQLRAAAERRRQAQLAAEHAAERLAEEVERRKSTEHERRLMIAELELKNNELEAKNAEMERFTYTVSHDLKSPLVTIRGFLGFVERDALAGNDASVRRGIQRINDATSVMHQLLEDLLELSRIGRLAATPESVSIREIALGACDLLAGEIGAQSAEITVADRLPKLVGDRHRLLEVFQNLISNAIRFAKPGTAPEIEIGMLEEDGEQVVFVRDRGVGIDPRYREQIFELFERLDPTVPGTGIGLAIVKRVVELHRGRIWVESEGIGHGCTFLFTLEDLPQTNLRYA